MAETEVATVPDGSRRGRRRKQRNSVAKEAAVNVVTLFVVPPGGGVEVVRRRGRQSHGGRGRGRVLQVLVEFVQRLGGAAVSLLLLCLVFSVSDALVVSNPPNNTDESKIMF